MYERAEPLTFFENGTQLTDAEIDAFEERVRVRLPAEYRAFLMSHNGGRVEPRTLHRHPTHQIQYFLSIGPPMDAAPCWDMYRNPEFPRMPPEHIPIAACEGGDLLTMIVDGPQRGQIFHWDHEEEGEDAYTYENLTLVAGSLDELLATLEPLALDL